MSKTTRRIDVAFIRKSTQAQDDQGQKQNVSRMLKDLGVDIPEEHWFVGTVSRRKVKSNLAFNSLMELVEADKVGTVYVESQDRWGTADRTELFALLGILREHDTRLFDLRDRKDLTERDFATEMLAIIGSFKSEKELQDTAYRSLRSRVNNFQATGSWPTGTHPYGYGKRCHSSDGRLLWEWQPRNRSRGQTFYPDKNSKMAPGLDNVPIPRKSKFDVVKLVPSCDPQAVKAVKLVFDLYVRAGLSRRQISARLNAEGLKFNGGHFTHPDITNILRNPAYVGDTHFGKVQTGELKTFDANGLVVDVKKQRSPKSRRTECLVKKGTHEALIDRKTWELAQKKLETERQRTSHSPRNPAYFLKQIFVCGHCGKGLTGRTETDRKTRKKTIVYLCPSYVAGRCNGHPAECGYQRITHEDAERLLFDKLAELDIEFEESWSVGARENIESRLQKLAVEDDEQQQKFQQLMGEGIDALVDLLIESNPEAGEWPQIKSIRRLSFNFYWQSYDDMPDDHMVSERFRLTVGQLRKAVKSAEQAAAEAASEKLGKLKEEHAALTRTWAKASDAMQEVLKADIDRLESEIEDCKWRSVPLSKRIERLHHQAWELQRERAKLRKEWPALQKREKGEAMRRIFKTVTLFWEKTFHPASKRPSRIRKTNRPGRWSFELQKDRVSWALADFDSGSFR
jgi:DNA invertase Pin-like site-specific DNA recombinase